VLVAAGIYLLVALACTQFPLLNYLGFEFSFVMGLVVTGVASALTIALVRRRRRELLSGSRAHAWHLVGALVGINLLLLLLPLAVMTATALVVRNCDFLEGLAFFLLLPVVTAVFATSLGFALGLWCRHPVIVFMAFVLLSVAYAAYLGYATPAVFSYNLFYGFFPGLSYDELLPITSTLVLWRLLTLVASALPLGASMLLLAHAPEARGGWDATLHLADILVRPGMRWRTALIVLALTLLYLWRCDLGFETTAGWLRTELRERIVTEHFVIHVANDELSAEERQAIAAEHEFRLAQILRAFSLQEVAPIESFLYGSVEQRRRLIGVGTTSIAKPWSRQIHLLRQSYQDVLKHELVHVVAGRFSPTIIHASYSIGLVEGLAMAVEWDWGNRTLHQYAAALHAVGRAPEIRSLMGFAGFARQAPSVSYVLAGSFCRYLIDRYGMRTMMAIYGGRSYTDLTGSTLEVLIHQWREFLKDIPVTEADREAVEVFFRTPPVFDRVCARVVARWSWEARRALEAGELGQAAERSWMAYREAGAYGALAVHLRALWQGGEDARLVQLADSVVASSAHPLQFLPLDLMRSDACWAVGERGRAETLVAHLVRVDLSPEMTEAAVLRLMVLRDGTEPEGLRVLFRTQVDDSLRRRLADSLWSVAPASRVAPYLLARLLEHEGRREEALEVLLRIRPGLPRFEAARVRRAAELMLALGRNREARTTFWLSLNDDNTPKSRDRVTDWIDRCEWMMNNGR